MANGPDHNWWSLLNHILTGETWAPFIRAIIVVVLFGVIFTATLIILGPAIAGAGAGGTLLADAGRRYLARRRRKRASIRA
ncbi:hypothetical protein [Lentzea sp. NPDC051838]|uniref:hypothetical protein n=1 Tax=Lentzea sp. NPDC051838 TaxID=3154849 RepID=UPI0034478558